MIEILVFATATKKRYQYIEFKQQKICSLSGATELSLDIKFFKLL